MSDKYRKTYGPLALVTGASSGIGTGFAEELAERGFDLILSARRRDRLDELAARLHGAHGVKVEVLVADLADSAAPAALLEATQGRDIGLLVSNAGFSIRGLHETLDPDELTDMLMVNCHAPFQLSRGFLSRMKARGRGGIVMVSSIEALMGCPYSSAYSATKALVMHLAEGLYGEAAGSGVDILATCPGATESEAAARAGIDPATLRDVQPARECAAFSLDNIANGPVYFPNAVYKAQFDQLLALPRREAVVAMASHFKG